MWGKHIYLAEGDVCAKLLGILAGNGEGVGADIPCLYVTVYACLLEGEGDANGYAAGASADVENSPTWRLGKATDIVDYLLNKFLCFRAWDEDTWGDVELMAAEVF